MKDLRTIYRRAFWILLVVIVIGYAGIVFWFATHEKDLIYPRSRDMKEPGYGVTYSSLVFLSKDGIRLSAWAIPDTTHAADVPWVLLLHGNGGNISGAGRFYALLQQTGVHILAVDYRGYGLSDGDPSEEGLSLDADAAYEYLRDKLEVPASHIVIFGRSLGAAVAVKLATSADAAGVILDGAFTSLVDRGSELYPFLPISLMLKDRYESIAIIDRVTMPKLFIHATDDEVVPIGHGRRLYVQAKEPKQFLEVTGGHEGAFAQDDVRYFTEVSRFIGNVTGMKVGIPVPPVTQAAGTGR
jgi:fermentation-respiration switch protein FrsA (DUF1100 family)